MEKGYTVDGFVFRTEAEAKEAKNEIEGIEYLKSRTNFKNSQNVLAVYNKVIEKELFRTPIGYGFLRELQGILINDPQMQEEHIQDIPVASTKISKKETQQREKRLKFMMDEANKENRNKITNLIIVIVCMIVAVGILISITNNSNNINILNYRDRLEREYEEKENELAIWDKQLREREQRLNELENGDR